MKLKNLFVLFAIAIITVNALAKPSKPKPSMRRLVSKTSSRAPITNKAIATYAYPGKTLQSESNTVATPVK